MHDCPHCGHANLADAQFCARCGQPQSADLGTGTEWLGRRLHRGRYELVECIGVGGMGMVFRAIDGELNRQVAIKVLAAHLVSHATARKRMKRESQALARLRHENVVSLFDVFDEGAQLALVLELVTGGDVQKRLQDGPVEPNQAETWVLQTLAGLAAIHAEGFVHRDIKPSNLLLTPKGQIKIADLGVAHDLEATGTLHTRMGARLGTPEYMSPEQVRGEAVDARSDLYSVGVVAYQMLVGSPPFAGDVASVIEAAHVQQLPEMTPVTGISPAWADVIERALAKAPADRFATAQEFSDALSDALHQETLPLPPPPPDTIVLVRDTPKWPWFAGGALLAASAMAIWLADLHGNWQHSQDRLRQFEQANQSNYDMATDRAAKVANLQKEVAALQQAKTEADRQLAAAKSAGETAGAERDKLAATKQAYDKRFGRTPDATMLKISNFGDDARMLKTYVFALGSDGVPEVTERNYNAWTEDGHFASFVTHEIGTGLAAVVVIYNPVDANQRLTYVIKASPRETATSKGAGAAPNPLKVIPRWTGGK